MAAYVALFTSASSVYASLAALVGEQLRESWPTVPQRTICAAAALPKSRSEPPVPARHCRYSSLVERTGQELTFSGDVSEHNASLCQRGLRRHGYISRESTALPSTRATLLPQPAVHAEPRVKSPAQSSERAVLRSGLSQVCKVGCGRCCVPHDLAATFPKSYASPRLSGVPHKREGSRSLGTVAQPNDMPSTTSASLAEGCTR